METKLAPDRLCFTLVVPNDLGQQQAKLGFFDLFDQGFKKRLVRGRQAYQNVIFEVHQYVLLKAHFHNDLSRRQWSLEMPLPLPVIC